MNMMAATLVILAEEQGKFRRLGREKLSPAAFKLVSSFISILCTIFKLHYVGKTSIKALDNYSKVKNFTKFFSRYVYFYFICMHFGHCW